jgi:heat shock protein HslJ
MRALMSTVFPLALVGMLVAACGQDTTMTSGAGPTGRAPDAPALFGSKVWELTGGSLDGAVLAPIDGYPVTLAVDEGQAGGTAACNHYGGSVTVTDGQVRLGDIGATGMACPAEGVMELEAAYLDALRRVTTGERQEGRLLLRGEGVELSFTPRPEVPDAALEGTVWELDTVVDGELASSTIAGSEATLELVGGQLSGTTGCNEFSGPAEVVGGRLVSGPLASTRMACEGVMDQEAHILAVLEGRPAVTVDGPTLTVALDDGRGLVYRAR